MAIKKRMVRKAGAQRLTPRVRSAVDKALTQLFRHKSKSEVKQLRAELLDGISKKYRRHTDVVQAFGKALDKDIYRRTGFRFVTR